MLNYKKPAFWVATLAIIAVVVICGGLISNPQKEPLTVEDYANQFIEEQITAYEKNEWTDVKIIDSKITKLEKIASFNELLSSPVEIWSLEYRLQPDDISKAPLPGGMNEVDGWITEDSSMGKPMLVFSYEDSKPQYLGCTWSGEGDFTTLAGQETAVRVFLEGIDLLPNETYRGNHIVVKFPLSTGETCQLFLSQPVIQGDLGIWCVERWMDGNGSVYYVTPQTDAITTDYYKDLQEQCDGGHKPSLLDPLQAALEYINNELGQHVSINKLVPEYSAKVEDFLITPESHFIGFITNLNADRSYFDLDQIEWLTNDDTERLMELDIKPDEMPDGYYIYNPNNYPMYCQVTEQTQYSIINGGGEATPESVTKEEFIEYLEQYSDFSPLFRIITKDGYVQSIIEQYVP